jgi:hypothetical protein
MNGRIGSIREVMSPSHPPVHVDDANSKGEGSGEGNYVNVVTLLVHRLYFELTKLLQGLLSLDEIRIELCILSKFGRGEDSKEDNEVVGHSLVLEFGVEIRFSHASDHLVDHLEFNDRIINKKSTKEATHGLVSLFNIYVKKVIIKVLDGELGKACIGEELSSVDHFRSNRGSNFRSLDKRLKERIAVSSEEAIAIGSGSSNETVGLLDLLDFGLVDGIRFVFTEKDVHTLFHPHQWDVA